MRQRLAKLLGINRELSKELAIAEIDFRKQLKHWRIDHGLTHSDVAVRSGMTVEWVRSMETVGRYNPTLSEIRYYLLGVGATYKVILEEI